jgi:hypothetical protein
MAGAVRAGVRGWRRGFGPSAYGWYLLGIGVMAVAASVMTRPDDAVADRYILLALLLPVGAAAVALSGETNRFWRMAIVVVVAGWLGASAVDHARHAARYRNGLVPNDVRVLVDALEARGITVAEAPYWRAYKATFMAQERVVVASSDVVRITTYEQRAAEAGGALVRIQESPCADGQGEERVGIWFLCRS